MTDARMFIHRFRRPIAAACAALAVLLVVALLRPAGPQSIDVIAAADDMPAGSTLTVDDVASASLPEGAVPPGALLDASSVIGRTLAAPLAGGEVVTETRLMPVGPREDGLLIVPVRLADAETADLLVPGTTIDLVLATGDTEGRIVAAGAQVVTVPRRAREGGLGAAPRNAGSLVVVATDRRTAVALAAVGSQDGLGVIIR